MSIEKKMILDRGVVATPTKPDGNLINGIGLINGVWVGEGVTVIPDNGDIVIDELAVILITYLVPVSWGRSWINKKGIPGAIGRRIEGFL